MKDKKTLFLKIIFVLCSIILAINSIHYFVNNIIIKDYNRYKYDSLLGKILYIFNIKEKYIAYYNNGNLYYQKEDYQKALDNYNKAVSLSPTDYYTICKIRINQSMAMVATTDFNRDKEDVKNDLIKAKENLYINRCTKSSSYYSFKKEIGDDCEEEIQKLIDKLDNPNSSNSEDDVYSEVESSIKENQKQASSSRQDELEKYSSSNYFFSGKRW